MDVGHDVVSVGSDIEGVRNRCMGIYGELSLNRIVRGASKKRDTTHIEYVKDPVELQPPGGDLFLITVDESRNRVAFALLGHLAFNFCNRSAIKHIIRQPSNRPSLAQLTSSIGLSPRVRTG